MNTEEIEIIFSANGAPFRKLVLLYLAFIANEFGQCRISYYKLAMATGLNVSTVIEAVQTLKSCGIITVFNIAKKPNTYQININRLVEIQNLHN